MHVTSGQSGRGRSSALGSARLLAPLDPGDEAFTHRARREMGSAPVAGASVRVVATSWHKD